MLCYVETHGRASLQQQSFLVTCTDNLAGFGLAVTDVVEQRNVGGTGELAGAAFDAVHDVVFIGLIEIVLLGNLVEQEWLQTHGAGHCAATAADAVGLTTVLSLVERHEQDA